MSRSLLGGRPQRLQWVFLATVTSLSALVAWLGWKVIQQDHQAAIARLSDRREAASVQIAAALERDVTTVEKQLDELSCSTAPSMPIASDDAAVLVWSCGDEIVASPHAHLLFEPVSTWASLTDADLPLVRIAREHLQAGRFDKAVAAFARVTTLAGATVGGMPAALAGRLGALSVYERSGDRLHAIEAARDLDGRLADAAWPISSATYRYASERAARWLPQNERMIAARAGLAEAIAQIWKASSNATAGRSMVATSSGPVLVIWRGRGGRTAAFGARPEFIDRRWITPLGVRVVLLGPDGRPIFAAPTPDDSRAVVRLASSTGLPWSLQVFDSDNPSEDAADRSRRRLVITGTSTLLLVVLGGALFVGRAVTQELAAARLQADVVAAVSHDFRTPLTTLCQLSELLAQGRIANDGDRLAYYEHLRAESGRLKALVDTLLDFGRVQSGQMRLRREPTDLCAMVGDLAGRFAMDPTTRAHRLELEVEPGLPALDVDRATMQCALWNLLENAAKYAPGHPSVRLEARRRSHGIEIAIIDEGLGIPERERRRIFDQFVRGSAAERHGIRGTGVGLTLAHQLVRAHGGEVSVTSVEGQGSTFVVSLPSGSGATGMAR